MPLPLADVAQDRHPVTRGAAAGNRHDLHLQRVRRAVPPSGGHLPREALPHGERPSRRGHDVAGRNIEQIQRAPQRLLGRQARQLAEAFVDERDARARSRRSARQDHDALAGVVDGRLEEGERLRHATALHHDRGERGGRQPDHGRVGLHEHEGLVRIEPMKRADAAERAPDRDAREDRGRRDCLTQAEAERDRDEERKAQKLERKVLRLLRTEAAEDEKGRSEDADQEQDRIQPRLAFGGRGRLLEPDQQKRGDEQDARRVPEPPREPDRPKVLPRREAREAETERTDRGAQESARARRESGEAEDVARALESVAPPCETSDQPGGDDRLERVADGDSDRGHGGARRPEVGDERTDEDSRPHPGPEEEKRGNRDPARRPQGRGARVQVREGEPQHSRADIDRGEGRDDRQTRGDPLGHGSIDCIHAAR